MAQDETDEAASEALAQEFIAASRRTAKRIPFSHTRYEPQEAPQEYIDMFVAAAASDDVKVVSAFLEAYRLSARGVHSELGINAMHAAAACNATRCLPVLIEANVGLLVPDEAGVMPLDWARANNHAEAAKIISDALAATEDPDPRPAPVPAEKPGPR